MGRVQVLLDQCRSSLCPVELQPWRYLITGCAVEQRARDQSSTKAVGRQGQARYTVERIRAPAELCLSIVWLFPQRVVSFLGMQQCAGWTD